MPAECLAARPAIEALYRAEARTRFADDPARIDEAVADNTEMALAECAQRIEVAACAQAASSAQQLEQTCLAPLDEEGREGDAFGR